MAGLDGSQDPRRGSPVSASWRAPLKTFSLCSLTQPRVLRRLERKPTAAAISGSMSVLFPVQWAWLMSCAVRTEVAAAGSSERSPMGRAAFQMLYARWAAARALPGLHPGRAFHTVPRGGGARGGTHWLPPADGGVAICLPRPARSGPGGA